MKIHHAALYAEDLERAKTFFETYFNAAAGKRYHNPHTGLETYFLSFDGSGTRLEIMRRPGLAPGIREDRRAGYNHIAFYANGRDEVDKLTIRLQADGYRVVGGPRITGDGYYESCILDAEGNLIEIVA